MDRRSFASRGPLLPLGPQRGSRRTSRPSATSTPPVRHIASERALGREPARSGNPKGYIAQSRRHRQRSSGPTGRASGLDPRPDRSGRDEDTIPASGPAGRMAIERPQGDPRPGAALTPLVALPRQSPVNGAGVQPDGRSPSRLRSSEIAFRRKVDAVTIWRVAHGLANCPLSRRASLN
jgi:hypothetical protein